MVSIKTIGRVLKERRTELGLGLTEAETFTKIQKLYIVALETDDYKALPGEFYVKAYLKQYAEKLGLNADKIIEAYEEGKGITVEDKADFQETYRFVKPSERVEPEEEETIKDWHYYLPIIALTGGAILIMVAVFLAVLLNKPQTPSFLQSNYAYSTSSTHKKTNRSTQAVPSQSTAPSSSAPSEDLAITSSSNNTMNVTLTNAKTPVKVVFTGNDQSNVWTLVRNSDMDTSGVTITPDHEQVTATLASDATTSMITLGRRSNLAMTINDKSVDLSKFTNQMGPYTINLTIQATTGQSTPADTHQ
ncbi:helix-turn-helix domain-containing protein [Lactococcus hircilactis]|uniref:Helix-turn-helix domain-containing protein n=1 Tax=Lactococcus hircilactis TaxID=1494462 RepID=A0A7X2CZW2_9LACT|nr:helix-turn-helix domain-containing protein [Lactococcus hircilactis]MQW38618.1 helix-turn-helix domain-containing protein [Lactococcus hircilactis]